MNRQIVMGQLGRNFKHIQTCFGVRELSVFGSLARDQAGKASDIDILVAFENKASFDRFMDLKFYLEDMLGNRVDLVTDKAMRPQIRSAIEKEIIHVS